MIPRLTDEECMEYVELVREHGSIAKASKASDIPRSTIYSRLERAAKRGLDGSIPEAAPAGFIVKSQNTVYDEEGELKSQSVRMVPDHSGPFNVPEGHNIKGVSALLDGDGNVTAQWIKTRSEVDPIAAVRAAFDDFPHRADLSDAPIISEPDLLSVYPIADQHHGLMAWGSESGENYDLTIGANRLRDCMTRLISQSPPSETALILNLGDFFHADDSTNSTPASGHNLDVDGRYFKVISTGVQLLRDCVDLALQKHKRVVIKNLPGNHDPHAYAALVVAFMGYYEKDPRVEIDTAASKFYFYRHGNALIGAHHGDGIKPDRMAMSMAEMRPEDWGTAKHRYFYFGHIHHETVREVGSCRVESFRTLAAKDAYTAGHGYQAGQSISSITMHRDHGEVGRHKVNL